MPGSRTTGVINGTDFLVYNGSNPIALSTTCSVNVTADMRDTSNKDSAGWAAYLPGQKKWTMTCEGLVSFASTYNMIYLLGLQIAKTSLTLKFATGNTAGDYYLTGTAYITSIAINAANEANTTFTVSFQGTGALAITDPLT